mmetsp:Transcript_13957/g.32386  ORF Transcript_13957/g.32386 Transcript_13957/m.32386 type:complete len:254 (-) Transcript_13957:133-894(-)
MLMMKKMTNTNRSIGKRISVNTRRKRRGPESIQGVVEMTMTMTTQRPEAKRGNTDGRLTTGPIWGEIPQPCFSMIPNFLCLSRDTRRFLATDPGEKEDDFAQQVYRPSFGSVCVMLPPLVFRSAWFLQTISHGGCSRFLTILFELVVCRATHVVLLNHGKKSRKNFNYHCKKGWCVMDCLSPWILIDPQHYPRRTEACGSSFPSVHCICTVHRTNRHCPPSCNRLNPARTGILACQSELPRDPVPPKSFPSDG